MCRYNLAAISFTPEEQFKSVKKFIPEFTMSYKVDSRQAIADTWPRWVVAVAQHACVCECVPTVETYDRVAVCVMMKSGALTTTKRGTTGAGATTSTWTK